MAGGPTITPRDPEQEQYRLLLLHMLHEHYARGTRGTGRFMNNFRYLRKKYTWMFFIGGTKLLKRTLDIVVAGLALILLAPLFLVVAAIIKATDRGPILFWQMRVGRWGREFPFPKFRSMVTNAEDIKRKMEELKHLSKEERAIRIAEAQDGGKPMDPMTRQILLGMDNDHGSDNITFKMKNDPRVTKIGRIIRKLSIDELPQLWCVLKGDMSLVGPRPPVPSEVAKYTLAERRRLDVIPGLTCIWQVSGRGNIKFTQQVQMDLDYIENQGFWFDIKLMFKTIPAVISGKGAF